MRVNVRVHPDFASAIAGDEPAAPEARQVAEAAERLALSLEPVHPGTDDPELACWFRAEAADPEQARRAAAELRDADGVEAAFVKPAEEAP